jgi:uncharacterized protein (DUF983 family)
VSAGLSGTVLPVHPQPKPDEIFSSWLCRIAKDNGIKLHTLEVQLWGRGKQIWTRDIDRSIDDATLTKVAVVSGTPVERAQETCLRSYEGKLFERLNVVGNSDWILPSGVVHRKRKHRSMQFCPLCLATDIEPYYRKTWRLALSTFCDLHDVLLHDCCPKCQSPVMFHRQELGNRWAWKVESLTLCTSCGFDLKRAAAYQAPVVEIEAWTTLKSQLFFLYQGWTFSGDETFFYSHLYFEVVRNLVHKLRSNWTTGRLMQYALQKFSVDQKLEIQGKLPFEFYGVVERHYLLQIATWYLLDWPNRFLEVGRNLRIRYSELMRDFPEVPFWFFDRARYLENKPLGPCDEEKTAMRSLWEDTNDLIKKEQLKRVIRQRLANNSINFLYAERN